MKILIAEDEAVSRLRLQARLVKWGYEVVVARDGVEAWELLQGDDAPSLAVIDWMMPGMDGPELCRRLRQQAREPYVYVLLLTGKDRMEDLIAGLDAGADDYVKKPVDAQELAVRIRAGERIVRLHSELLASRQAMWFQATHDPLTKACNRAAALDALRREVTHAERDGTPFSVAIADLDHFKQVNDTCGHLGGDLVLQETARRFASSIRPCDTLARYGGEEFLAIFPSCDASVSAEVAERMRAALADSPFDLGTKLLPVTCSIGVATFEPGLSLEHLVKHADEALYDAKSAGRNRVLHRYPRSFLDIAS